MEKYHIDNKLNHLSGEESGLIFMFSFNTKYSTKRKKGCYNIRKIHPSLAAYINERDNKIFTKKAKRF